MSTFRPSVRERPRPSPELGFYPPPQLRHLRRLHPILRQHEQLPLLGPDMALEQTAETVHLVVRAGLDRRGFRQSHAWGKVVQNRKQNRKRNRKFSACT